MENISASINFKFDNTFCIYFRLSKGKKLSNPYSEPTTSRIANVVSSPPYDIPCNPPLPPRNPDMTYIKQYSLPSLEGGPGTLEVLEAANEHSFTTMTRIPSQNQCLQPYRNKLKLALMIAVLTVVMVTVPAVYDRVINQKAEIHSTNIQKTEIPTDSNYLTFNGM